MKKLFLRAEFGPLWEPWEEDEIGRKILSTEGFFRKSTFCTLMDSNPGFDRQWVMPEIFLLNGTFIMLEMTASLFKTFFISMHSFKSTM